MKKVLVVLLAALILCATIGYAQAAERVYGFSQCEMVDTWRVAETKSMQDEAAKRGIRLIYTDAGADTAKQVADIEDIIAQKPDLIFIAPREMEGFAGVLDTAKEAGIPVILLDRDVSSTAGEDYLTVISANFIWEGATCAQLLNEYFGGKPANIVQLEGTPGSSVAIDRKTGFDDELKKYPNLKMLASQVGDFNRAESQKTMANLLQTYGKEINAVYGHSDDDCIGAIQAIKSYGLKPGEDIVLVGIDGCSDGMYAIIAGEYYKSVQCSPIFGPIAFDTAEKYFAGEKIPTYIQMPGKLIDKSNVDVILATEGY